MAKVDNRPQQLSPQVVVESKSIGRPLNGKFIAGPTPVIMQYLPPNHHAGGGIQYLQLIPTRPLIVPISPYMQYNQYSPPGNSQPQSSGGPNYGAYQGPPSGYQPTLQTPLGGYSNNYLSYFRPHSGMQIVTSPLDLSLNTNEYLPMQGENGYKTLRRP